MIRYLIPILFAAVLVAGGCGKPPGAVVVRTTNVTEEQAIGLAKDAVREHDSFADSASYEAEAQGDGWAITVTDTSSSQSRIVFLDSQGKVVNYQ